MKQLLINILLFLPLFFLGQVYDVSATESFNNTTNLSTDGSFGTDQNSVSGGFADAFNVSSAWSDESGDVTSHFSQGSGSVFIGADIDGFGGSTPSYLEIFNYTVDHDDEVGFAGNFALPPGATGLDASSDILTIKYTIDGGSTWSTGLTITANSSSSMTFSDGTIAIDNSSNVFRTKEFRIGTNIRDSVVKVRVEFSGFTSSGEYFALDEFRIVKVREVVESEGFSVTTDLSTSSGGGTFGHPTSSSTCDDNDIYNVSSTSNITNCVNYEVGSVFVLNHRLSTSASDGEELEMLSYTATDNNELSFRGNFTQFGSATDPDNNVVIQYSTDNGSSYTTGLTFTGNVSGYYDCSDGTDRLRYKDFTTKGFTIGSNLSGQTIKIKAIFNGLDNNDDGIAFDEFKLEKSKDAPLPVELLSFNAYPKDENVHIEWVTASEINNDYFEVQRSSDGINYETNEIVDGNGTSSQMHQYELTDFNPLPGLSYYRIRQVDFDGQNETFNPVPVNFEKTAIEGLQIIRLNNTHNIEYNDLYESNYKLIITDNLGRIVLMENIQSNSGHNSYPITLYTRGVYHASIIKNGIINSCSFVN